jgi:hypothetical protein
MGGVSINQRDGLAYGRWFTTGVHTTDVSLQTPGGASILACGYGSGNDCYDFDIKYPVSGGLFVLKKNKDTSISSMQALRSTSTVVTNVMSASIDTANNASFLYDSSAGEGGFSVNQTSGNVTNEWIQAGFATTDNTQAAAGGTSTLDCGYGSGYDCFDFEMKYSNNGLLVIKKNKSLGYTQGHYLITTPVTAMTGPSTSATNTETYNFTGTPSGTVTLDQHFGTVTSP